jgi:hypothetical protein
MLGSQDIFCIDSSRLNGVKNKEKRVKLSCNHEGVYAYIGGVTVSLILNLGTRWMHMVSNMPQWFYPHYPLSRMLDRPQSWLEHFRDEKNLFPFRIQTLDYLIT